MTKSKPGGRGGHIAPTTPGKPRQSGSRQQTGKDQVLQSGSRSLDEEATRRTGKSAVRAIPPNAK